MALPQLPCPYPFNMPPIESMSNTEICAERDHLRAWQAGQYSLELRLPIPGVDSLLAAEQTQRELERTVAIRLAHLHDEIVSRLDEYLDLWSDHEEDSDV